MQSYSINVALSDIAGAIKRFSLAGMLGWQDVRQKYKRSAIGPFWLTISMGLTIGSIGIVFGQIYDAPMTEFLPFLAAGLIMWGFISETIKEGCTSFIEAEEIIRQLPIPLFVHILRMIWRNMLILAHNLVILPIVFLIMQKPVSLVAFLSVPGFILVTINLAWVALMLGIFCARYRDLPQMVISVLQVVFYLTPIIWMPSLLAGRASLYVLDLNPFYHLLEIVRAPLLGQVPTITNWVVSAALALIGWGIALAIYGRYKHRIAFWV